MVKRIGLFGGSFNPIHIGHLVIAEAAWQEFELEKVIFIPSGDAVNPVFSSYKENIEILFIMIQSKFPDHFFLIVFQEMGGHTVFHRFIV